MIPLQLSTPRALTRKQVTRSLHRSHEYISVRRRRKRRRRGLCSLFFLHSLNICMLLTLYEKKAAFDPNTLWMLLLIVRLLNSVLGETIVDDRWRKLSMNFVLFFLIYTRSIVIIKTRIIYYLLLQVFLFLLSLAFNLYSWRSIIIVV